ncbi:hypothetical protein D1007_32656 [Hordeum vulgare]|nr:hypothetical protein D1007_32656 [Hordeum vulgare]
MPAALQETSRILFDLEEGNNVQDRHLTDSLTHPPFYPSVAPPWFRLAANVGFCRVIKLVSIMLYFRGNSSGVFTLLNVLQAKHDAGKLVFTTIALLVASLSKLLVRSSNTYCSDKESDCSQGNRGEEANVGVVCIMKARAGRGPASNPQNLYAKRRREKINDKLQVLQKLVPNGTKVHLSTMLEEAVLYVKFLKLQIKFWFRKAKKSIEQHTVVP